MNATSDDDHDNEVNSPVCYARDADPAYMGYASRDELIGFLNTLLEAERAGARVTMESARAAHDSILAELLHAVHRDEARWCAMLIDQIARLGGIASTATGAFYDKAMAIADERERAAFLNRGQDWVSRKLREWLPRIHDDRLHAALQEMLASHDDNIARTQTVIDSIGGPV